MNEVNDPYADVLTDDDLVDMELFESAWQEYEEKIVGGGNKERGAAIGVVTKTSMAANSIDYYLTHCGHLHTQKERSYLSKLTMELRYFDVGWGRSTPSDIDPERFTH